MEKQLTEQGYSTDLKAATASPFHRLLLLLGANLGNRVTTLRQASDLIVERIGPVDSASDLYETAPWGLVDQPAFINQVLLVKTSLLPDEVLQKTQLIERELGRIRHQKWGARAIDIDILYYDELIQQSTTLTIPHPYLHQRRFTLVPLAQVAPAFVHPILQKTSVELVAECDDEGAVSLFGQSA